MTRLLLPDYIGSDLCECNFHRHETYLPEEQICEESRDPSMKPVEEQRMKEYDLGDGMGQQSCEKGDPHYVICMSDSIHAHYCVVYTNIIVLCTVALT